MHIVVRPITTYPQEPTAEWQRRDANFRADFSQTLRELGHELGYLGAEACVLEADFSKGDIRIDGWPKADARPRTPRIVLLFEAGSGLQRYPCDTFNDWQDNLRAIRLTLEKLRAIERYGVAKGQQYAGFKALPSAGNSSAVQGATEAADVLARWSHMDPAKVLADVKVARLAYKAARRRAHPDSGEEGASSNEFDWVQKSAATLALHHGVAALT